MQSSEHQIQKIGERFQIQPGILWFVTGAPMDIAYQQKLNGSMLPGVQQTPGFTFIAVLIFYPMLPGDLVPSSSQEQEALIMWTDSPL